MDLILVTCQYCTCLIKGGPCGFRGLLIKINRSRCVKGLLLLFFFQKTLLELALCISIHVWYSFINRAAWAARVVMFQIDLRGGLLKHNLTIFR